MIAISVLTFWYTHFANNPLLDDTASSSNATQIDSNFSLQANCSTEEDSSKIEKLCVNETSGNEGKIE